VTRAVRRWLGRLAGTEPEPEPLTVECPRCDGTGQTRAWGQGRARMVECRVCDGTGLAPVDDGTIGRTP
jgi:hypothetical protein